MKVVIKITQAFKKQAKPLLKKYASLPEELRLLEKDLTENPHMGIEIMPNVYKIHLAIKSKGKGKSGGARVIDFHQKETAIIGLLEQSGKESEHVINLISIYDKSDVENISNAEIKSLIESMDIDQ
jgi:mRNA-degrading endonuclease RelE of RelBE toxin-antitoxin system